MKGKGQQKRNIVDDMDDDAQQATPKKMKPESSEPSLAGTQNPTDVQQATPKKMKPESSDQSDSGTENHPTDAQQTAPQKMKPEFPDPSDSGTENHPTDAQQTTPMKMKPKSPQSSVSGTQNHPIDVDATLQRPLSSADCYWIKELGLKNRDKYLIMNDYWLNDRVINAAMKLMWKIAPNFAGLADVFIAKKDGFPPSLSIDGFVQIVNVQRNSLDNFV